MLFIRPVWMKQDISPPIGNEEVQINGADQRTSGTQSQSGTKRGPLDVHSPTAAMHWSSTLGSSHPVDEKRVKKSE